MARRKPDRPRIGDYYEINKLIARFLEDVAKDFSEFSDVKQVSEPIIYGFNVRVNPHGQPIINSFGNVKPTEPKVAYTDEREPLVDVIDKDKEISIIAEVPGVAKDNIKVTAFPDEVLIEAKDHTRSYSKIVRLSGTVSTSGAAAKFRHGVLELTFKKTANPQRRSTIIKIKD